MSRRESRRRCRRENRRRGRRESRRRDRRENRRRGRRESRRRAYNGELTVNIDDIGVKVRVALQLCR